jgi:tetratricopeptide (TPR) repeat protein
VLFERGEFDEAIAHYQRAVQIAPGYSEAFSNLGNALRASKSYDEALAAYERALELQPDFVDGLNNLGTALRDLGRWREAEAAYERALALSPGNPKLLSNLALALKEREDFEGAAALLSQAVDIDPDNVQSLTYLALVRLDQKQVTAAEDLAGRALSLAPDDARAINALGLARFEQQDSAAALDLFQRAIGLAPELADAHNNLGNVRKEEGRLDEARQAYEKAIELDPGETAYDLNLSDAKTYAPGDGHLEVMRARMDAASGLSQTGRMRLNFALAKAYEDLGRHDEAFACLSDGNRRKRQTIGYDEAATLGVFDRIRATFDARLIDRKSRVGSTLPVFIVGMPRSGTTLVEQILASHPAVFGGGELNDFGRLVNQLPGAVGESRFRYPEDVTFLSAAAMETLGEAYAAAQRARAGRAKRATDKMPANFLFLGLIHMALPNARIVHVMRDPRDTCLSCYSKLFSMEQGFSYDLEELGRYYRKYAELMAHWRSVLPPGVMLDIRYEDVVGDLEGSARALVDHCGLAWDSACLRFHETARPIRTASASQVHKPIYQSARGRWRRYERHLSPLSAALGDLCDPADLELDSGPASSANAGRL